MAEWIEWNGGECPVPSGTKIEGKTRKGSIIRVRVRGGSQKDWGITEWSNGEAGPYIIAYRIVEDIQ